MRPMISLSAATLRRGNKLLWQDVSLHVHPGQRVGIVGKNGVGKSSLFKLLLGELELDHGELQLPATWVMSSVSQEEPSGPMPALEFVASGDAPALAAKQALDIAQANEDDASITKALMLMDDTDAHTVENRAAKLLDGLGFKPEDIRRPIDDFSGGWRMRLALAFALMCPADLLLLDEPTNHLDLDTVLWLENWLKQFPGTLLLISHDREFIDSVVTHVAHVEHQSMKIYTGGFSTFEKTRAMQLEQQQQQHEKHQRRVKEMEAFITRFKAKATKAKQAQSRVKALARMGESMAVHSDSEFHFRFKEPEKNPNPMLNLIDVSLGYDTPLLNGVNMTLLPASRIGLIGPNGAGKSTLIKHLAGKDTQLTLFTGERSTSVHLKVGYFEQHQIDQLDMAATPVSTIRKLDPKATDQELRDFVGGFGFIGDQALAPVGPMSGGEKARLALAAVVYEKPNLLLLDEPTNHLDLDMRRALTFAIQQFDGAVVLVAHDRYLLRAVCDELWLVADGQADVFNGDLDDYSVWLRQRLAEANPNTKSDADNSAAAKKEKKRLDAAKRHQQAPLRKKLKTCESKLEKAQTRMEKIQVELVECYENGEAAKADALNIEMASLRETVDTLEEEWLELSEELA